MAGLNSVLDGSPLCITENGGELIKPHLMFRFVATANTKSCGADSGQYPTGEQKKKTKNKDYSQLAVILIYSWYRGGVLDFMELPLFLGCWRFALGIDANRNANKIFRGNFPGSRGGTRIRPARGAAEGVHAMPLPPPRQCGRNEIGIGRKQKRTDSIRIVKNMVFSSALRKIVGLRLYQATFARFRPRQGEMIALGLF